jgi:hypothetical protein
MMGYALLWIESLAAAILAVAAAVAWASRFSRRGLRRGLPVAAAVLLLAAGVAACAVAWLLRRYFVIVPDWLPYALSWTLVFAALAALVLWRGGRGEAAAAWSAGRLGVGCVVAAALAVLTFWNMDLAAGNRLAALKAEAGALALSVAPARVPDGENAALVYAEAWGALGDFKDMPAEWNGAWATLPDDPSAAVAKAADPAIGGFLEARANGLALLRRAAGMKECTFDRDWARPSPDMLLPEGALARDSARLLALDALHHASASRFDRAAEDVAALFGMAGHLAQEPVLISVLVAVNAETTALDALQALAAAGPDGMTPLAAVVPDPALRYRRAMGRAMRMEEAFGLSCFTLLANDPGGELGGYLGLDTGPSANPLVALWRVFLMQDDIDGYRRLMREYRTFGRMPLHEARRALPDQTDRVEKGQYGPLTRLLAPALTKCFEMAARADAQRDVLAVAQAALRFRQATGRMPASPADLVPAYLAAMPADPFDGEPLRMKAADGTLIIYSIADNMTDDGGTPWDKKTSKGDIVFRLPAR